MTTLAPDPSHRSQIVDIAKGIAIILVVYGHCVRGLDAAHVLAADSPLIPTDYIVYAFHMPMFFLLSGLFFRQSAQKDAAAFWIGKFKSIVYPYFLWSLIQGGVQLMAAGSGAVNASLRPDQLWHILWAPISPFWFLYALFFCNVISWLVMRWNAEAVLAASLIVFLATFLLHAGVIEDVAYGYLYFTLGIVVTSRGWMRVIPASWTSAAAFVTVFLMVAYACLVFHVPERLPLPAALLGMLATLTICNALHDSAPLNVGTRSLATVGRYSMSIYVMHILVLGFVRLVLLRKLHIADPAILIPAATVVAILVPMLVQLVGNRLRINPYIGLPSPASGATRQLAVKP